MRYSIFKITLLNKAFEKTDNPVAGFVTFYFDGCFVRCFQHESLLSIQVSPSVTQHVVSVESSSLLLQSIKA